MHDRLQVCAFICLTWMAELSKPTQRLLQMEALDKGWDGAKKGFLDISAKMGLTTASENLYSEKSKSTARLLVMHFQDI